MKEFICIALLIAIVVSLPTIGRKMNSMFDADKKDYLE
jgi:hypothetical protein